MKLWLALKLVSLHYQIQQTIKEAVGSMSCD